MRFGDLLVRQLVGVAMGMSPAPSLANLFVTLHEVSHILQYLETFLFYLKRFIDDGFGIWLHDADPMTDDNMLKYIHCRSAGAILQRIHHGKAPY